jgi:menaquinol-cytochrome c reductase iron-sulfur subunit
MTRRDFYKVGTVLLSSLIGLVLTVPGVAYIISPLRKKGGKEAEGLESLTRLSQLKVGQPRAFPIIADAQDAWIRYPKEPIGSVWLIREGDGQVKALTAECPHLGCAVGLAADAKSFFCPCHTSSFDFQGKPLNKIPPRPMDDLKVTLSDDPDPIVQVKFERFRTANEEKIPLV